MPRCAACAGEIRDAAALRCPHCDGPLDTAETNLRTTTTAHDLPDATAPAIERADVELAPLGGARFPPGHMFASRFRVVSLLGRGAMGEVYRAEDLKLGQPVALELLSAPADRSAASVARFASEVRLAEALATPTCAASSTSAKPMAGTTCRWSTSVADANIPHTRRQRLVPRIVGCRAARGARDGGLGLQHGDTWARVRSPCAVGRPPERGVTSAFRRDLHRCRPRDYRPDPRRHHACHRVRPPRRCAAGRFRSSTSGATGSGRTDYRGRRFDRQAGSTPT